MPGEQLPVNPMKRCNLVTAGMLLLGLGTAVTIYLTAEEIPDNPFAEYEQSKRFSHEVQRMGGKMALVANDAGAWFAGLWQGKQLAWTVACITMLIALVYYVIASGSRHGEHTTEHNNEGSV